MNRRSAVLVAVGAVGTAGAALVLLTHRQMGLFGKLFAKDFHGQNLKGRDFSNQKLAYANFRGANCEEVEFFNADLQHADMRDVNFDMGGISGADCSFANFEGAVLSFARGRETANYSNASFRGTDLSKIAFYGMGGTQNRAKKNHMMDPGSGGADMNHAVFDGAKCVGTYFNRCNLIGASFVGANCQEADFTNADCSNANFTDCDLRDAKFDGANTSGAIFTGAKRTQS